MATTQRTYGHFCMLATALEHVGDRWALLIVRDLVTGPRRFTDLQERLGGITAKTLSVRLRELEADGLVGADRVPGRREVWYSLTEAGAGLTPVIEDLVYWALEHALTRPEPGEPAHPEHLLMALRILLERKGVFADGAHWVVRLADDGSYTMRGTASGWSVTEGAESAEGDPDVIVTATKADWADFLANEPGARAAVADRVRVEGSPAAVATFRRVIDAFPFGPAAEPPGR